MFKICEKKYLTDIIFEMSIEAPRVAKSALPGQFVIVIVDDKGERVPLTISDVNSELGLVKIVVQPAGNSTKKLEAKNQGEWINDFVGPLGNPSEFIYEDIETLKKKRFIFASGGLGTAPIYPQVKYLTDLGISCEVIIGAKTKSAVILEKEMRELTPDVYIATDDGSYGFEGNVAQCLEDLVKNHGKTYDHCICIGPMIMMKFTALTTKSLGIPTTVSLNPIMVDGTGMCGACRVSVGGKTKFACVDGPEFDGHLVDFDQAIHRQRQYVDFKQVEKNDASETSQEKHEHCVFVEEPVYDRFTRVPVKYQNPEVRKSNFDEVCLGYSPEEAIMEAKRCLECKNPQCVTMCPVEIQIPDFIREIAKGNFEEAARVLSQYTALPAVCGRVCPQETQCELKCILAHKGDAVSIGKLERFAADYAYSHNIKFASAAEKNGHKVAVVGSGPAGIACAGELAKKGYDITIFEALQKSGGVLVYGIPEFRLPKSGVVQKEIDLLEDLGVKIENDVIVGRTITVEDMFKEGYEAVFIASGAGLPIFMGIPGENANGVFSANEYLTRTNLMQAYDPDMDTPVYIGRKVVVIGGGNVAMDAARTAKRLGSDVSIVYRRTKNELPARSEEVENTLEEGIHFEMLTAPTEILVDANGWVKGMQCIRMELGEADSSGRRRPVPIEGSEFSIEVDAVIMALGTTPNPLIHSTTEGLEVTQRGCLIIDPTGRTTHEGVFAGGDVVTGSATVILAMGAGKTAAKSIDEYIMNKK